MTWPSSRCGFLPGSAHSDTSGDARVRKFRIAFLFVAAIAVIAACDPLTLPADTSKIALVSTTTAGGWKYDYYRNSAYPCAVSGYQTFVVGTKVGSSNPAPAPLWAFMHGGGAGYFDVNGNP